MNIRKCEAFVRAVELGSISKAAEELGYTQSGLSHMMQSLEEDKNRAIEEAFARAQVEMKAVHENLAGEPAG